MVTYHSIVCERSIAQFGQLFSEVTSNSEFFYDQCKIRNNFIKYFLKYRKNLYSTSKMFLPQCVLVECVPKSHSTSMEFVGSVLPKKSLFALLLTYGVRISHPCLSWHFEWPGHTGCFLKINQHHRVSNKTQQCSTVES